MKFRILYFSLKLVHFTHLVFNTKKLYVVQYTYSEVSVSGRHSDNGLEGALVLADGGAVWLVDEHWWVLITQDVYY